MTNKMQFFSTSEARKHLGSLINQVRYQNKRFSIGRHGQSEAFLIPSGSELGTLAESAAEPIKRIAKDQISVLAKKYKLDLIILFGSHAKGTATSTSDLDIAFMSSSDLTPKKEQDIYDDFAKVFQREDIDLINLKTAYNVLLEFEVLTYGEVLYQKSRKFFLDRKLKAFFNYQDFSCYFKQQKNALFKKLDYL